MRSFVKIVLVMVLLSVSQLSLAGKKTIGIVVFEGVLGSDILAPAEVFGAATRQSWFTNYQVQFIGLDHQKTITTAEGVVIGVDQSIDEVGELSALLLPSRYDMADLINNKQLMAFIRQQATTVDWLASNCSGALLLAEAGLLDGKKATTWLGGEQNFKAQYPRVDVQASVPYVVDGNIITSNGSVVSYAAALKLLAMMSSESFAHSIYEYLQMGQLAAVAAPK